MDHVSILLVHYNTDRDTRECLRTLQDLEVDGFHYTVIVLDNASKKPLKVPASLLGGHLELLRSEKNLGFTGGNNLLIEHAIKTYNSDYLVLLNTDTLVQKDFVKKMRSSMKQHPDWGLVCPKIYFPRGYEFHQESYQAQDRGRVFWYAGGSIDWRNLSAFHRGVDEVDRGQFDSQVVSDFATGCCVMVSRGAIETVGMFDDRYFLYLEDVDLSIRARLAGYVIGFCPETAIWHKNAGSSGGSGSRLQQYYQSRNRVWFTWRYGVWRSKITALRLVFRWLLHGNDSQRSAAIDVMLGRLGKRTVI